MTYEHFRKVPARRTRIIDLSFRNIHSVVFRQLELVKLPRKDRCFKPSLRSLRLFSYYPTLVQANKYVVGPTLVRSYRRLPNVSRVYLMPVQAEKPIFVTFTDLVHRVSFSVELNRLWKTLHLDFSPCD